MDGRLGRSYRNSANAPEVVDLQIDPFVNNADTQKSPFGPPIPYQYSQSTTSRLMYGIPRVVIYVVVVFMCLVLGGVIGGSIGRALFHKSNRSTMSVVTTTNSTSGPSKITSTMLPTITVNAAGCSANNGSTYASSAYPGSNFVILCDTDIQATTNIGPGQLTYTLEACLDECARNNDNATRTYPCIGAIWVLSSPIVPTNNMQCFLKALSGTQVSAKGQILAGGLLL
ncbi:hypothetical protein BP5796_03045 [Coleophoma crateriformis]|uniref:Apple domain-containing protein n=1 Tax=Coleophoma crateriformis TaxID=565419 RepID=A0A3D8SMD9_9HELO|nr:hypothetical protein BP5796_03045 [Coleophoma crateriformis]